ncbi:hypothetical protein JCM19000A_31690 [Silvimonas sp. JCM 19000]
MINMYATLMISGEKFVPEDILHLVESGDDVNIRKKGALGSRGRYKFKPFPKSSFHLTGDLLRVLDFIENINEIDVELDKKIIHITVAYKNQCNFELSPEILFRLSRLELPFGITCYEDQNLSDEGVP